MALFLFLLLPQSVDAADVVAERSEAEEEIFFLPGPGPVYKNILPRTELVAKLGTAEYILVSDVLQTDVTAHIYLAEALIRSGRTPAIGLQSISTDKQPILDAFNRGETAPEALAGLLNPENPEEYARYLKLFVLARQEHVALYALNLPYKVMLSATLGGLEAVPEADRGALPPEIVPPPKEQLEELQRTYARHAGFRGIAPYEKPVTPTDGIGSEPSPERFIRSVALVDSALGRQALRVQREHPERPLMVLAKDARILYGYGIASRIRHFAQAEKLSAPGIVRVVALHRSELPVGSCDIGFMDSLASQFESTLTTWDFVDIRGPLPTADGSSLGSADSVYAEIRAVPQDFAGSGFLPGDVVIAFETQQRKYLRALAQEGAAESIMVSQDASDPSLLIGGTARYSEDIENLAQLSPQQQNFLRFLYAYEMTPMAPPPASIVVLRQGELVRVWVRQGLRPLSIVNSAPPELVRAQMR